MRTRAKPYSDQRVEVVGEALGRGGVAAAIELVDQRVEALSSIAFAELL